MVKKRQSDAGTAKDGAAKPDKKRKVESVQVERRFERHGVSVSWSVLLGGLRGGRSCEQLYCRSRKE